MQKKPTYSVYYPFRLMPTNDGSIHQISNFEEITVEWKNKSLLFSIESLPPEKEENFDSTTILISLRNNQSNYYKYGLNIRGFHSQNEAEQFSKSFSSGLFITLLELNIPFFIKEKSDERKDGATLHDEDTMLIYDSIEKPQMLAAPEISLSSPIHYKRFLQSFLKGLIPYKKQEQKIDLALELFNQHFIETTKKAKFLTLVTILEILAVENNTTQIDSWFIDKIMSWENDLKKNYTLGNDKNNQEYENLVNSLEKLKYKYDTISKQIRLFVILTLNEKFEYKKKASKSIANDAILIYDVRSKLVHEGREYPKQEFEAYFSYCFKLVKAILCKIVSENWGIEVNSGIDLIEEREKFRKTTP